MPEESLASPLRTHSTEWKSDGTVEKAFKNRKKELSMDQGSPVSKAQSAPFPQPVTSAERQADTSVPPAPASTSSSSISVHPQADSTEATQAVTLPLRTRCMNHLTKARAWVGETCTKILTLLKNLFCFFRKEKSAAAPASSASSGVPAQATQNNLGVDSADSDSDSEHKDKE